LTCSPDRERELALEFSARRVDGNGPPVVFIDRPAGGARFAAHGDRRTAFLADSGHLERLRGFRDGRERAAICHQENLVVMRAPASTALRAGPREPGDRGLRPRRGAPAAPLGHAVAELLFVRIQGDQSTPERWF
jgi:LacI family transcriptional regulator